MIFLNGRGIEPLKAFSYLWLWVELNQRLKLFRFYRFRFLSLPHQVVDFGSNYCYIYQVSVLHKIVNAD